MTIKLLFKDKNIWVSIYELKILIFLFSSFSFLVSPEIIKDRRIDAVLLCVAILNAMSEQ